MSKKTVFSNLSEFFQNRHTPIILATFFVLSVIFLYLRFQPIGLQTVPYTYDQGRDFLAARDIIINKDFTLIGPTTGAGGVFHGAWWYYFLAIPFVLTGGSPTAFYYSIAISALIQALLFSWFLYRKTHPLIAVLCMSLLAISPYFIRTSIFAISSILTLPFILLLMFALYQYIDTKKLGYLALLTFSIGMIFEAEVAFGMLLIPAAFITIFLAREVTLFFGSIKKILYASAGFVVATCLRIVFELKYGFLQTKAFWAFKDTGGTHEIPISHAFFDRIDLFTSYYEDIFTKPLRGFGWIVLVAACAGLYYGYKKFTDTEKKFVRIIALLITFLFLLSSLYHKNFFWAYYYEGIQYFFIGLLMFGLYGLFKYKKELAVKVVTFFLILFVVASLTTVYNKLTRPEIPKKEGLLMHTTAIDYIHKQVGSKPYCLRIYTPPVITHTYSYLLDLHARTQGMTYPRTVYQKHECWYLIEQDENNERRDAWLKGNIPDGGKKTHEHVVSKNLVIQKWEYPVR